MRADIDYLFRCIEGVRVILGSVYIGVVPTHRGVTLTRQGNTACHIGASHRLRSVPNFKVQAMLHMCPDLDVRVENLEV